MVFVRDVVAEGANPKQIRVGLSVLLSYVSLYQIAKFLVILSLSRSVSQCPLVVEEVGRR